MNSLGKAIAAVALFALTSSAFALPYVGLSFGRSTYDDVEGDSLSDQSYAMIFGYSFMDYVGIELSHNVIGEVRYVGKDPEGVAEDQYLQGDSRGIAAVGTWPVMESLWLRAKAGMERYDADGISSSPSGNYRRYNETGVEPFYGVGVELRGSEQIGFGLWYEQRSWGIDSGNRDSSSVLVQIRLSF